MSKQSARRWMFQVQATPLSQPQVLICLDAGGNDRPNPPPWIGSLEEAHSESAIRVGLWEDRTGLTAYRIEIIWLGPDMETFQ